VHHLSLLYDRCGGVLSFFGKGAGVSKCGGDGDGQENEGDMPLVNSRGCT
jgi:hypothetical protein